MPIRVVVTPFVSWRLHLLPVEPPLTTVKVGLMPLLILSATRTMKVFAPQSRILMANKVTTAIDSASQASFGSLIWLGVRGVNGHIAIRYINVRPLS